MAGRLAWMRQFIFCPSKRHAPAFLIACHDVQATKPGGQVWRHIVVASQHHGQAAAHRVAARAQRDRGDGDGVHAGTGGRRDEAAPATGRETRDNGVAGIGRSRKGVCPAGPDAWRKAQRANVVGGRTGRRELSPAILRACGPRRPPGTPGPERAGQIPARHAGWRRYISRQSIPSSTMWISRPTPNQRVFFGTLRPAYTAMAGQVCSGWNPRLQRPGA